MGVPTLRFCVECKRKDFTGTLEPVSLRRNRHTEKWRKRCDWWKANPRATLLDAKKAGVPGVSFEEEE